MISSGVCDGDAVHADHNVSALDSGLRRGALRLDVEDEDALPLLDAEVRGEILVEISEGHSEMSPHHARFAGTPCMADLLASLITLLRSSAVLAELVLDDGR